MTPSDVVVQAVRALGGECELGELAGRVRRADPRGTRLPFELAVGLAVVAGHIERVQLEDGREGVRLVERPEAPA